MKLVTKEQMEKLLENGRNSDRDHVPVVKIFTPDANATWLLSEAMPDDPDLMFGLCDLGMGFPELGYARLSEIQEVRGSLNLPPERDLYTVLDRPMSEYSRMAQKTGRITC